MSGGDRFRGKLNQAQLNLAVKIIGFRSKFVENYVSLYYVKGVVIPDIVSYTGAAGGNVHRDITKIARLLNFIELYNEYARFG
tara:strand:+ start:439 stop:687 length:249 start_codon:yes stop_codon:yes gene_type:complete